MKTSLPLFLVGVDQVAFLRNFAGGDSAEPSHAAVLAQLAGADGIACRLRRDRQLIRDRDLYVLREVVKNNLILHIAPDQELLARAVEVRPELVILSPETEQPFEWTGLDFESNQGLYFGAAEKLKSENLKVGFFIQPDEDAVKAAARARVDLAALNCREFTGAGKADDQKAASDKLEFAGQLAVKLGLETAACGGLLNNHLRSLLSSESFHYITVGRGVIGRAMMIGMEKAVAETAAIFKNSIEQ